MPRKSSSTELKSVPACVGQIDEYLEKKPPRINTEDVTDTLLSEVIERVEELDLAFRNLAKLNRVMYDMLKDTNSMSHATAEMVAEIRTVCASRCEN